MYDDYELVVFNDGIGRTCFGEVLSRNENLISIKNPATIMVSPNEANQMKVDVIPLFFAEFIEEKDGLRQSIFTFNTNNITLIEVNITERIKEHYFTKINVKPVQGAEPEIPEVKLFED